MNRDPYPDTETTTLARTAGLAPEVVAYWIKVLRCWLESIARQQGAD